MTKSTAGKRTPLWVFIYYPENGRTLEQLREVLGEMHLTYVVSPLHDEDKNPDGSPKKPHYHVLIKFPSNKTYVQVKGITDKLSAPIPQPCVNICGQIRYFIHIDNPEKAQYQRADIITSGQIDIDDYFKVSQAEKARMAQEILLFCEKEKIDSLYTLNEYCMRYNPDWFSYLYQNTYYIDRVLTAKHRMNREKKEDKRQEERDNINKILVQRAIQGGV